MSNIYMNKKRFILLGWKILESKYRYYIQDSPTISDEQYDAMEREYDKLAIKLNLVPSATDMVGFDVKRPSCIEVARKVRAAV